MTLVTVIEHVFPFYFTIDDDGDTMYFTAQNNTTVYRIYDNGFGTVFCGQFETVGFVDGPSDVARFSIVHGLTIDGNNQLLVCDPHNNAIRKVSPEGDVSIWLMTEHDPTDIVFDRKTSTAFFYERSHSCIKPVSPAGLVSTLAQQILNPAPGFVARLSFDSGGNIMVVDNGCVKRFDRSTQTVETHLDGIVGVTSVAYDAKGDLVYSSLKSVKKRGRVDFCRYIKKAPELRIFPPGLVPLIASYLPTEIADETILGKGACCLGFNSKKVLFASDNCNLFKINDIDGLRDNDDDYSYPKSSCAADARYMSTLLSLREKTRVISSLFDWLMRLSDVELEDFVPRDYNEYPTRARVILHWATESEVRELTSRFSNHPAIKTLRYLRSYKFFSGARGLQELQDKYLWHRYLDEHEGLVDNIGAIPESERRPADRIKYAHSLSIVENELARRKMFKLF